MSFSWLNKQRKQALLDLSAEAGHPQNETLRKDEIVEELHDYLQENARRLSRNPTFEGYYGSRGQTPFSTRQSIGNAISDGVEEVKSVVKSRGRRPTNTRVKQEPEDSDAASPQRKSSVLDRVSNTFASSSSVLDTRPTPSTQFYSAYNNRLSVRAIPGPPSPAAVASAVEHESKQFIAGISDAYSVSGIPESIDSLRDVCSSVTSIQLAFLLAEAVALQYRLFPWHYLTDTPAIAALGIPSQAVYYPDLFVLLTGYYWSSTLLWTTTSIALPALVAYFFNLTFREVKRGSVRVVAPKYAVDPLIFNIAKAVVTYLAYAQHDGLGSSIFGADAAGIINTAMLGGPDALLGGPYAILTGCAVGGLASLYEAAQRK